MTQTNIYTTKVRTLEEIEYANDFKIHVCLESNNTLQQYLQILYSLGK